MKIINKFFYITLVGLLTLNTSFSAEVVPEASEEEGEEEGIVDKCAAREEATQCKCYTDIYQYLDDKIAADSFGNDGGDRALIEKLHQFYGKRTQAACETETEA